MAENLPTWPRMFYQGAGGKPYLFYVVLGTFKSLPSMSEQEYRSDGVFPGLDLAHYDKSEHADMLDRFREGYYPWDSLKEEDPALADKVSGADECFILKGELQDQSDLNYLRDTVGLLTFLLDHGGVAVHDPQMFGWWRPEEWKEALFEPGEAAVPQRHVVILTSEDEQGAKPLTWFHTRGLRKFGRPDLSIHHVPPRYDEAVIDLFTRFINFQALGGVIEERQEVRMKTLPKGMICRHAGTLDNPDFNNVHVEISPPGSK